MKFPEYREKTERISVNSFDDGVFYINDLKVPGSVLLFPKIFYMWGVVDAHEIKPHTLELFKVVKPKPSYLIIGTGKYKVDFNNDFYEFFKEYRIKVEVMPTYEAVIQFNVCNEDELNVAAALIPNNL